MQFIRLHESAGQSGQSSFAGESVTVTSGSTVHSFPFPTNLPSSATANKDVLLATAGFGSLPGGVTPDYIIPANFLILGAGGCSVNFAGVSLINFGALPTDGVHSLDATGTLITNTPGNFSGAHGSVNVGTGVCCSGTSCSVTTQSGCSGTWTSGGSCSPTNPCSPPPPPGVCCSGVTCRVDVAANCTGANTAFTTAAGCNAAGNTASPCCRADFNHTSGISVQDIFDYLSAWFSGSTSADFDGNGASSPTVQSIFDFLAAWFAGC